MVSDGRISCADVRPLLFAALEAECPREERAEVTAHLALCAECRADLERERALTALLRGGSRGDARPPGAPWRVHRRLAVVVTALAAAAALSLPLGPKAYGSIVSSTLSPLMVMQDGARETLLESNHVSLPAGTTATIEIADTASVRAAGPAAFELDLAGGEWKVTLHRGQLALTVLEGRRVRVASAWGTRALEAGEHLVTPAELVGADGREVAEILNTGLRAFIEMDWRPAALDLALVADHPGADPDQRAQALFYLAAAYANLGQSAEVVATVDRWLAGNPDTVTGRSSARYWKGSALEELGRAAEARAIYESVLREDPDTAYAPHIRMRLGRAPQPSPEPAPEPASEPGPGEARSEPADDARVLWSFPTGAPSFGSAAAADLDGDGEREIVFGTYFGDGHLYALRARTGTLAWKVPSGHGPRDASVLIADVDRDGDLDVLSADSATGVLECLDAAGRPVWTARLPSGTDSPPAVADLDGDGDVEVVVGTMIVHDPDGAGQGRVVALAGDGGQRLWSAAVPGHVQSEPGLCDVDGDGVLDVLVTTWNGDGRLRALDGRDGKELWSFETGDSVYHGVSFADFDGDGRPEVVVADRRGTVWMLEAESGAVRWRATLGGEHDGSVFGPTTLVDADGEGPPEIVVCGLGVHVLDAAGRVLWERPFGATSIARGAVPGDVTGDGRPELVFGAGTRLLGVRASDGETLLSVELGTGRDPREGIDHAPLVLDVDGDGRLEVFVVCGRGAYEGREDNYGRAVLVQTDGRVSPGQGEWLTFRGGPRRAGRASD